MALCSKIAWRQQVPMQPSQRRCLRAGRSMRLPAYGGPGSVFDAFDAVDEQMAQMQRQMDSMFPASSSVFSDMRRMQEGMDREMDRAFADAARLRRQVDAEVQRSIQQAPKVQIERFEERGPHSYRSFHSIQISSGHVSVATLTPATSTAAAPFFSPFVLVAAALAAAYTAATIKFSKNFNLTTFKRDAKFKLVALWPFLSLTSKRFREQFVSALRGIKVNALPDVADTQGPAEGSCGKPQ